MTAADKKQLADNLAALDVVLQARSPFVYSQLAAGATAGEIAALRAGLGGAVVEPLEIWFQWHNGATSRVTDLLPLGSMISIRQAVEERKGIAKIPFIDKKRKNAIKLLDDGSGDGYFLDIASAEPRVFYYMLEDPYPQDYGTLAEFVQFITQVHQSGIVKKDPRGMADFNLSKYDALESKYLKSIKPKTR